MVSLVYINHIDQLSGNKGILYPVSYGAMCEMAEALGRLSVRRLPGTGVFSQPIELS